MLLSMYASYHLAKKGKKSYIFAIAVFVILFSFLPAISPFPLGIFLPFPTFVSPVLSFPFYAYTWAHTEYGVFFFTVTVIHTTESSWGDFFPFIPFPIFLLVNFVGAILGYGMSKIFDIREWGTGKHWSFLGAVLGVACLGFAFLVMGAPLFLFGILVLAIVIGRILWSKISLTK